jgi:hypothetical protein
MNYRHGDRMALNRHDRKRGFQPRDTTCRYCKKDLGTMPVMALDVSVVLKGFLELGKEPGTFLIQAHSVYGGKQEVICPECGAVAYHVIIVDYYTVPETVFFDEGQDPWMSDA